MSGAHLAQEPRQRPFRMYPSKRPAENLTSEQRQEIVQLYVNRKDLSLREIGMPYGLAACAVRRLAQLAGAPQRQEPGTYEEQAERRKVVVALYEQGLTWRAIGAQLNIHPQSARGVVKRAGKLRTKEEPEVGAATTDAHERAINLHRFFARVVVNDPGECWPWAGPLNAYGYPELLKRVGGVDAKVGAHREAYSIFNGPIPEGMTVDHMCFNPACCNPGHLRLLTHVENAGSQRRCFKGGRS